MKKGKHLLLAVLTVILICLLSGCIGRTCHYCGNAVGEDPVEAGGRYYCSYSCYGEEFLFGE